MSSKSNVQSSKDHSECIIDLDHVARKHERSETNCFDLIILALYRTECDFVKLPSLSLVYWYNILWNFWFQSPTLIFYIPNESYEQYNINKQHLFIGVYARGHHMGIMDRAPSIEQDYVLQHLGNCVPAPQLRPPAFFISHSPDPLLMLLPSMSFTLLMPDLLYHLTISSLAWKPPVWY